jgi:hypothetical protein
MSYASQRPLDRYTRLYAYVATDNIGSSRACYTSARHMTRATGAFAEGRLPRGSSNSAHPWSSYSSKDYQMWLMAW